MLLHHLNWLFGLLLLMAGFFSAGHALLYRRDPRAALVWILICLFIPGIGFSLYWLLGVNRIRTRARSWQTSGRGMQWLTPASRHFVISADPVPPFPAENLAALLHLSNAITRRPLTAGNRLRPLINGNEIFPAMLQAIAKAEESIFLSTYIFGSDRIGRRFINELGAAAQRGVDVRVLVDALGERYALPSARSLLNRAGVRTVRFLPPFTSWGMFHLHLRNHRKLLTVDRRIGFTGGINIGRSWLSSKIDRGDVIDLHFQAEGPVVGQIEDTFLEDWHFATGEEVSTRPHSPPLEDCTAYCRGISAGPNEDFEKLRWLMVGALDCARQRVRIMTPYFIPDRDLISSINSAALRGVKVEIILPGRSNLPYVHWATRAYLWELLEYGTRIYYRPPPFAHNKLLLVDTFFALVGSANLDPRSLRLNFEFNVEVFDPETVKILSEHFEQTRRNSRQVTLEEVDGRPLPVRLRDSFCKLFSPFL
ncbi:MAG: cardiolipin synthase [Desulfuromonadaceae bacterium]|nr:cardiolipin synthase [Desulfuromonadaceae bacterium]